MYVSIAAATWFVATWFAASTGLKLHEANKKEEMEVVSFLLWNGQRCFWLEIPKLHR